MCSGHLGHALKQCHMFTDVPRGSHTLAVLKGDEIEAVGLPSMSEASICASYDELGRMTWHHLRLEG